MIYQHIFIFTLLTGVLACSSDDSNDVDMNEAPDVPELFGVFPDNVTTYGELIQGQKFLVIETDDIPNHASPYFEPGHPLYEAYNGDNPAFQLNPNQISSQNIVIKIPMEPVEASTKEATPLGAIGISRNGVVFYNQYAGPDNQPLTIEINSFDQYLGHPQQLGAYHYHQEPIYLTSTEGREALLGWLLDGFPVYGPQENGQTVTNADLDEYHGHQHATAEYPDGIYHYHITSEDPYINGSGFFSA